MMRCFSRAAAPFWMMAKQSRVQVQTGVVKHSILPSGAAVTQIFSDIAAASILVCVNFQRGVMLC